MNVGETLFVILCFFYAGFMIYLSFDDEREEEEEKEEEKEIEF